MQALKKRERERTEYLTLWETHKGEWYGYGSTTPSVKRRHFHKLFYFGVSCGVELWGGRVAGPDWSEEQRDPNVGGGPHQCVCERSRVCARDPHAEKGAWTHTRMARRNGEHLVSRVGVIVGWEEWEKGWVW